MTAYYQPRQHEPSTLGSTPTGESLPVVVVGAGPVGLATALGLARRGVPVTVLEAATQVSYGSRAICVSRHSLEVADRLGFGEALAGVALPWVGGRSFYGDHEVLRFTMPQRDHDVRPPMVNVSQSELEEIVVDAVEAHPLISLHWGVRLTGLETYADGALLRVETAGGERTVRADWVVAADGGRSTVRELAGLRLQGTSYEGRYVIADIHWESGLPTERMVWFDPPSNPGSTVIMHRQPGDIWRIDYQLAPEDDAEVETTEARIRERIAQHLDWLEVSTGSAVGGDWTLEWQGFYSARALALDSFVHDRLVFAGDAAHLVPIFGVRGLNSGLEDAETLGWMLAAVVRGAAPAALLDAYSAERHDAWEQNIAAAGKSTLIMTPGGEGHRLTRDALLELALVKPEFSHLIDPRQSSATHARRSPLTAAAPAPAPSAAPQPGDPLEDRRLLAEGKETSLHELRGSGFGVYAVGPLDGAAAGDLESLRAELAAALPHEQVATVVLEPGADGGAADAWQATAGEVVVVRPDGLVLARGRAGEAAGGPGLSGITGTTGITGLTARLLAPGEPAGGVPDPVTLTPEQAAREEVWLTLSQALDAAADPTDLLTRLALVLGAETGPDHLRELLAEIG